MGKMKKFANELDNFQLTVYEYLKKEVNEDGSNMITILNEIEDGFLCVPDNICETYSTLNQIQRIEVMHFFTKYIMRKNS